MAEKAPRLTPPRRIYGVDFSGARDAGQHIWITRGEATPRGFAVEACLPAQELPGGGMAREPALRALRDLIESESAAAFALDVPFGLPLPFVRRYRSWEAFVRAFPRRHASPEAFRAFCRARDGGRELRRLTDREARTPFSPYNLRMYRQTYHALRAILAPLVGRGAVCVPPMQPLSAGKPWLLEICPAVTLKRMGLYRPYKGRTAGHAAMRRAILSALAVRTPLSVPRPLARRMTGDTGGDALDSLIAAATAFRLLGAATPRLHGLAVPPEAAPMAALEAWVYQGFALQPG